MLQKGNIMYFALVFCLGSVVYVAANQAMPDNGSRI